MAPTTRMAIAVLLASARVLAGGVALIRTARAMPAPDEPGSRTVTGRVSGFVVAPCGTGNRRRTCSRPVVEYEDGGTLRQLVSRSAHGTSPYERGGGARVRIVADGTAWLDDEWQADRARLRDHHAARRRLPLWAGWLLAGCGGLGLLLAAGLGYWVDESGPGPDPSPSQGPHD
jgi:hypothetical protein